MTDANPVFRVPLYVEVDAPGVDYLDAAHLAERAIRQLGLYGPTPVKLFGHEGFTVQIRGVKELDSAFLNGWLAVIPKREVREPTPVEGGERDV
jgi:hypothetical protein